MSTVADLNGHHIGATIVLCDGGATYTGTLRFVHHDRAMFETTPQKVFLGIDNCEWKHSGHYPSDHPVEIAEPQPAANSDRPDGAA